MAVFPEPQMLCFAVLPSTKPETKSRTNKRNSLCLIPPYLLPSLFRLKGSLLRVPF